ncbi:hypothetical protein ACFOHK_01095 [Falsigemmobacter intermedius]|uniref:KfrA N-terminal DNA-binding domain-containing protein n=1 Tax=Falsigemmobacter intermedius TaxID=1553448 RepID=A0A451GH27_9RHOB|nr:hypothetical protein [Falsigemmobacter intermedius]RWY37351.1 hypothetical protein EP867_17350 [Falsigemmobacter intermedius]
MARNRSEDVDAKVEAAIEQLETLGAKVTKTAVQEITRGSNSTIFPAYDRVMQRRAAAVEPTEAAQKLFVQLWSEAVGVARGERADEAAALEEMAAEIERLNSMILERDTAAEGAATAAEEAIAAAKQEAEAAIAAAHTQAAADEKATAVLRAERDLIAADKVKLEAQVAQLQDALKNAEIGLAKSEAKLEVYRSMQSK